MEVVVILGRSAVDVPWLVGTFNCQKATGPYRSVIFVNENENVEKRENNEFVNEN